MTSLKLVVKCTKNMPTTEKEMKTRDKQTLNRFQNAVNASNVLSIYFQKGFKSVAAIHAVVRSFFPEVEYLEMLNYWNLRKCDPKLTEKLNTVLEKLNHE